MPKTCAITLLGFLSGAAAGPCTDHSGKCTFLSDGMYCPVNDVREHADVNKDVALVAKHLKKDPPDYAAAKTVYTEGVESSKGGGIMRTLQDLAQKDMTSGGYTNVFYSGALDLYGTTDAIWHDWIIACLDATAPCNGKSNDFRNYVINKGLIGVVTAYVTYEMGAAIYKAADGQTSDTGAAYNWDEAAAFHIGRKELLEAFTVGELTTPGSLYSPWEFNWKRDADFPDGVKTHAHAPPIFNHGLLNLRDSNYDAAEVKKAQDEIYKIYAITAIRSAIKYGWKAYGGGSFVDKYLAEGALYWRSASGYLSTFNKTVVQQVDDIFDLQKTTFSKEDACQVLTLVESLYDDAGISCAEVGTWKDAEDCLASACSGGSDTLSDGDTNYVSGCVEDDGHDHGDDTTTTPEAAASVAPAGLALASLAVVLATVA
mmetsp:Transcript_25221/g.69321  ORF Transcript_25221/g.69321 Transcript_25221/m.69321 type:complete len:429 (-) Transcript_25221:340-1626(-)